MLASTDGPPRWMRVSAACAFGAAILLALTVHALVWSGLAEGTESPFGRERLPVLDAGQDLGWFPAPVWIAFWLALGACVAITIRLERGREDRYEPWSLAAALLAALAVAVALRGVMFTVPSTGAAYGGPTIVQDRSSAYGFAFVLGGVSMVVATVALVRIARHGGRRRGAVLALGALLIPPGSLWWVYRFLVAPDFAQRKPDAVAMELPTIPSAQLDLSPPGAWRPVLEMYLDGGGVSIHAREPDRRTVEWSEYVREVAQRMESRLRGDPDSDSATRVPNEAILLRADARLPVRHVLDVVEVCGENHIWKLQFATGNGVNHVEGFLRSYLSLDDAPLGDPEGKGEPRLEIRGESGPDGAHLRFRWRESESDDLEALLDEMLEASLDQRVAGELDLVWIAPGAGLDWGDVARVACALEHRGRFWNLARLDG